MLKMRRCEFGDSVRALRTKRGWSQERLAKRAGLHRTYISDVERGVRNSRLATIVRIANALRVSPARLLSAVASYHRRV
jgi:transcriptional regulator with XRE-family HTH domain